MIIKPQLRVKVILKRSCCKKPINNNLDGFTGALGLLCNDNNETCPPRLRPWLCDVQLDGTGRIKPNRKEKSISLRNRTRSYQFIGVLHEITPFCRGTSTCDLTIATLLRISSAVG